MPALWKMEGAKWTGRAIVSGKMSMKMNMDCKLKLDILLISQDQFVMRHVSLWKAKHFELLVSLTN